MTFLGCIATVAVIYDLNANTVTVTISITQNCMIRYATINYEMFLFCFVTVKEFLAQAKEEFQKKWDHPPPVSSFFFFIVFFQEIKVNKTHF